MKKILIILLINILLIPNIYALDISSKTAVLYNLNDKSIVLDIDSNKKVSIASLTKIMTCLVAIEHIEDINKEVVITYEMLDGLIASNAYVVGLKKGQKVTMKDLLYATFLESGADAARGLALSLASSEKEYVKMMNDKASSLNLNLHFANVVGLDDENNYGTANDVAKLFMIALENPIFKEMVLTKQYKLSDSSLVAKSSMFESARKYEIDIPYILGGKTGYTVNAGKCLASIAYDENNNINYLLVTTGANTSTKNAYHVLDSKTIYEYYFANYKYYNVLNIDDILTTIKVKYSKTNIDVKSTELVTLYHDKTFDESKIKINYEGVKEVSPFVKDKYLGKADVYYDDKLMASYDITSNMLDANILRSVKKHLGWISLGIIGFLMMIFLALHLYIRKKYIKKKVYR